MKVRKFEIIECPQCKYEYLPAEIFIPKYYFGHPTNIERTSDGKLVSYEGSSVDLFEKFTCENCGTDFRVVSKLQLTTQFAFTEEYISKLPNVDLE